MSDTILKRFDRPDIVRTFEKGRFEVIQLAGWTLGRATYEPGWKWSVHVGKSLGKSLCDVEHIGIVIAGSAAAALTDRGVIEMHAGDVFYIPPGHDSWVIGDEPYISLHVMGAADYAAKSIEVVLAVPQGHEEDRHDEEECADLDTGIPDLCRMCDDR